MKVENLIRLAPWSYLLAFFGAMSALTAQYFLRMIFPSMPPFLLLYPFLFILAWALGAYPALLSLLLMSVGAELFFISGPFSLSSEGMGHILNLGFYTFNSLFVIWVVARGRYSELRVKEGHEWFQTTLKCIGDAVIVTDDQGRVLFLNFVAEQLTGYSNKEAYKKAMREVFNIVNQESRLPAFNPVQKVLSEGIVVGLANHTVLISKGGSEYMIEDSAAPIRIDNKNRVSGVVLVFRDVTQKYLAQAKLIESEELFRKVSDDAPSLIWRSGTDKRCDWFNKGWFKFTGRTMEEELGMGWTKSLHPEDLEKCIKTYEENFDLRREFSMNFRLLRADGVYRWILDKGAPRFTKHGEFLGFIGTCVDIHEEYEARIARDQALEEAQEALHTRDEFMSMASHELKTPLTSLNLQLQLLSRSAKKALQAPNREFALDQLFTEKLLNAVSLCEKQSWRLASLLEELLDLTRIRLGRFHLNKEQVNLSKVSQDIVQRLLSEAGHANISITTGEDVTGLWDRGRIEQILTHLLTNALKYGEQKPIDVRMEYTDNLQNVRLEVQDRGLGIDTELQEIIFERFGRGISGKNISGLGLGLYITRQIVEAHGGSISVSSVLGKGSTFTVILPTHLSDNSLAFPAAEFRTNPRH